MKEKAESVLAMVLPMNKAEESCYLPYMVCATVRPTALKTYQSFHSTEGKSLSLRWVRMDRTHGEVF